MANIVFIIGEHPTEVVAAHHARQVAKILESEYGHTINWLKTPLDITSYGRIRGNKPTKEILLELAKNPLTSGTLTRQMAQLTEKLVVNFHCTPAHEMGKATTKHPRDFSMGNKLNLKHELVVAHVGNNGFIAEVPALYQEVPERTLGKIVRKKVTSEAEALLDGNELTENEKKRLVIALRPNQQIKVAGLKTPGQEKYLHEDISRKLAAEIHRQLQLTARVLPFRKKE